MHIWVCEHRHICKCLGKSHLYTITSQCLTLKPLQKSTEPVSRGWRTSWDPRECDMWVFVHHSPHGLCIYLFILLASLMEVLNHLKWNIWIKMPEICQYAIPLCIFFWALHPAFTVQMLAVCCIITCFYFQIVHFFNISEPHNLHQDIMTAEHRF